MARVPPNVTAPRDVLRRRAAVLRAEGVPVGEVARLLGVHRRTVARWHASGDGAAAEVAATAKADKVFTSTVDASRAILTSALTAMAQRVVSIAADEDPAAALRAIFGAFDRVGLPRTEVIEAPVAADLDPSLLTAEEFAELRRMRAKMKPA